MGALIPHLDALSEAIAETIGQLPDDPALLDPTVEETYPSAVSSPEFSAAIHSPNIDYLQNCSPSTPLTASPDGHTAAGPSFTSPPISPDLKAELLSPENPNIASVQPSPISSPKQTHLMMIKEDSLVSMVVQAGDIIRIKNDLSGMEKASFRSASPPPNQF